MNREEAILLLHDMKDTYDEIHKNTNGDLGYEQMTALDMAIEALQAEPTKAVPPSLADVYKWERDIALSQLEEYGIGFAEKKRDDLVEVVRCKDCRHADECHKSVQYTRNEPNTVTIGHTKIDFCSHGERREP